MKKLLSILPIAAVMLLLSAACTHNNGDIGKLFGKWKLTSIEYQGVTPGSVYQDNVFINFQNTTVCLQQHLDVNSEAWNIYGSWILEDETLTLDFTDSGQQMPDIGLPALCRLQVLKMTGSEMILIYRPDENSAITYQFRKW